MALYHTLVQLLTSKMSFFKLFEHFRSCKQFPIQMFEVLETSINSPDTHTHIQDEDDQFTLSDFDLDTRALTSIFDIPEAE